MNKVLTAVMVLVFFNAWSAFADGVQTHEAEVGVITDTTGGVGAQVRMRAENDDDGYLYDFKMGGTHNGAVASGRLGIISGDTTIEGTLMPDISPISWTYGVRVGKFIHKDSQNRTRAFVDAGGVGPIQESVMLPGRNELAVGIMTDQQINSLYEVQALAKADILGRHVLASAAIKRPLGESRDGTYIKGEMIVERLDETGLQNISQPGMVGHATLMVSVGKGY